MRKKQIKKSVICLLLAAILAFSLAACKKSPGTVFQLTPAEITVTEGDSVQLSLETDVAGTPVWGTSNPEVATVTENGAVTGVAAGTCTVTVALSGHSASCAVTVLAQEADYNPIVGGEINFSYLKDLHPIETIDVVEYNFGTSKHSQQGERIFGELVTLSVMQGLLARTEGSTASLYINMKEGGMNDSASETWLDEIVSMTGAVKNVVTTAGNKTPFEQILEKYKGVVTRTEGDKPGFILFEQKIADGTDADNNPIQIGKEEVNAACTIASATGYLAVDATSKELAESIGYEMAVDARGMSERDAYDAYSDLLASDIVMLSNNGQAQNRDLGVALKTYFMYESNKDDSFMNTITAPETGKYRQGTLGIGWSSTGEVDQVNRHAMYGWNFTCTNYSYNLSQTARLGDTCFKQKAKDRNLIADPTKKYVTFIMTDGDNVTWHQNDFPFSEGWYGYKDRGTYPMGWTMAPVMADMAPNIIKKEYEMATKVDQFVCGVSGSGYIYPSEYLKAMQSEALAKFTESTNEYMRRADLRYVEILDNDPFNKAVMDEYAKQSNIYGGFVLANYDYYKQGGDLKYFNGKPFLGIGEAMWSDTAGRVAHRLNSLPVDITSANGYTAVKIHCWTTSMADVTRMVEMLDPNIEIVTPGEMMKLVAENVPADSKRTAVADTQYPEDVDEYVDAAQFWRTLPLNEKTEFNFDTYLNYDGWNKHIGSKQYDYVSFSGEPWKYSTSVRTTVDGGSGYSIRLDGSDYGVSDNNPNASIYSKLRVPDSSSARFSFFVQGEAYGFDADYRVRIITNENGTPTLSSLDQVNGKPAWIPAGDNIWREVSYDVSKYRGQEIVFIIEHNATQREGDGEILYIDNIKLGTEVLDLAAIKKGNVNANTTFDFAENEQGFKWVTANGGTAGYSSVRQALEANVAAVPGEGADAAFYTRFDLKTFNGYTHSKFGVWAQTEAGKTAEVRLAAISADGKQILRSGMWTKVSESAKYLSFDLDSIRLKGGAFKYADIVIEARGCGQNAKVYLDQANFKPMYRDLENGYYYDAEYLQALQEQSDSLLETLENWILQAGRGVEDTAECKDGKIRLYGYDFMRGSDMQISSKSLDNFAKVKNEFNARMIAKVAGLTASELSFDVERIEKTLLNQNAVVPQIRVLFIAEDNTITVLKNWQLVEKYTVTTFTAPLTAAQGKAGVLMIEMDCAQNGDRAGVNLGNMILN